MKPFRLIPLSLVALLASLGTLYSQEQKPAGNENAVEKEQADDAVIPEWQMEFENLNETRREQYTATLFEASRLFNQKRIIEALNAIGTAEIIYKKNPAALNLKGACYVELRDFDRARTMFEEALALQKIYLDGIDTLNPAQRLKRMRYVSNVLFNLAEMDFVTGKWQDCHDGLEYLLKEADPQNISMNRLMEFKLLLTKLKLDRVAEARELAEKYDYLDDNPYYYYANAAISYFDEDVESAERWRNSARKVFNPQNRKPQVLAPWEDTMIEFGYVKSFYGGDLEDPSAVPPAAP